MPDNTSLSGRNHKNEIEGKGTERRLGKRIFFAAVKKVAERVIVTGFEKNVNRRYATFYTRTSAKTPIKTIGNRENLLRRKFG
jgi:nitrate reductase alpha subunit